MLTAIRRRLEQEERGFTLIELMVVVLIIAILIAIAIPTFLGARRRAQDKQAQSNLKNAHNAEKTFYVDNQVFTADGAAGGALEQIEPSLNYTLDDAWVAGVVPALGATDQVVVLRSESRSGTVFCLADVATGTSAGTYYASGTACPATDPPTGWSTDSEAGW